MKHIKKIILFVCFIPYLLKILFRLETSSEYIFNNIPPWVVKLLTREFKPNVYQDDETAEFVQVMKILNNEAKFELELRQRRGEI